MDENKESILDSSYIEPDGIMLPLPETIVFENCEWCFQFDDDEPKVFASVEKSEEPTEIPKITFTLLNTSTSNIVFSHNGREFKLFARELSKEGIKIINNDSQNKETQS